MGASSKPSTDQVREKEEVARKRLKEISEKLVTRGNVTRDRDFSGCSGRGFGSLNN